MKTFGVVIFIIAISAVMFFALQYFSKKQNKTTSGSIYGSSTVATDKPEEGSQDVAELKIEVLKEGQGDISKKGDTLSVHYTGTLLDGTKFDSSVDRGTPFEFTVGAGMVIKGWDEGMLGMKVGEKRKLTIPSSMGYGKSGVPPVIPGEAALVFEVELLAIK